jgi:hypothetical protein
MLTQIEQSLGVIELRNYLMAPDARDRFIEYFETHFIDSQGALNDSHFQYKP